MHSGWKKWVQVGSGCTCTQRSREHSRTVRSARQANSQHAMVGDDIVCGVAMYGRRYTFIFFRYPDMHHCMPYPGTAVDSKM